MGNGLERGGSPVGSYALDADGRVVAPAREPDTLVDSLEQRRPAGI